MKDRKNINKDTVNKMNLYGELELIEQVPLNSLFINRKYGDLIFQPNYDEIADMVYKWLSENCETFEKGYFEYSIGSLLKDSDLGYTRDSSGKLDSARSRIKGLVKKTYECTMEMDRFNIVTLSFHGNGKNLHFKLDNELGFISLYRM